MSSRPVGYAFLQAKYSIQAPRHFVTSEVLDSGIRKTISHPDYTQEIYQKAYWPGDTDFDHLEFALRYEGLNLPLLRLLLPALPSTLLETHIKAKPTGAYARKIWLTRASKYSQNPSWH